MIWKQEKMKSLLCLKIMIKKIFLVIIVLLCCGCQTKQIVYEKEYIDSMNNVFLFDKLDDATKSLLKKANGDKELDNYQLKMINKNVYCDDIVDIKGNVLNLTSYPQLVFDIVSVKCPHCKRMIINDLNHMLDKGITLVQYFNVGTKEEILNLYKEINIDIPNNLILIEHNDKLENYIKNDLNIDAYPTIVCFDKGKVSIDAYGELNSDNIDQLYELGFNTKISVNQELINSDRSINEVRKDLSNDNLNRLRLLDNDDKTEEYTLKIIGSKIDFNNITKEKSDVYINEIDNYETYKNENLVLIFSYLNDEDITKIDSINSLIESNDDINYIVVLIEGIESSSVHYKNMNVRFKAPVTSILGYTPDDFYKIGISNYPTALFIEKGTYVGAYSNIDSIDNFNEAINLFIGEKSIALKKNN